MPDKKSIVWVVGSLDTVGGGEQLLFEGAIQYRSLGYEVHIITWSFNEEALFDGKYEKKNIHVLISKKTARQNVFRRALYRACSLFALRRKIKELDPDLIICQNEYDVAVLYLATLFRRYPYIVLIFGQSFQFPHDIAKYSLIFRRHLKPIVASMEGYRKTIPIQRPKTSLMNILANELICIVRYIAVRKAKSRITFSKQVQWEVFVLYKVDSIVLKGAYPEEIFDFTDVDTRRQDMNIPTDKKVFLSLSRLDRKKRIDLCIKAFHQLNLGNSLLLIGGKGEDAERLNVLVDELNIRHKVRFLGYVPQEDVWGLKKMCNVFVSLDIADYDITAYEALALGSNVVWTDEIDMDQNLESCKNLFIAKPNIDDVAAAMQHAANNTNSDGTQCMRQYTWSSYFNGLLSY